ncbi:MAG: hypothetical protein FJ148_01970 [Deltaproteobacteria bacterium]|nr:hypothetical protein [Deltaproteobacteria bacterium]
MTRRRVVVIGLHGGGPHYTEPLAACGRLPVWSRLAASGLTARTESTWPVAAGAWVTLLTGLDVAQHGVVDTCEFDARRFPSLSAARVDARAYAAETLLSIASSAGRSVAAVSVPMTSLPWPVNGVVIPSVPVADEVRPPTFPPELVERVAPMSLCRCDEVDPRDVARCRRYLDFDLERVVEVGTTLYLERDWDLFLVVFKVPDIANHLFCEHPSLPGWRALIDEYLERTDAAMGRFLETIHPESTVLVLSDHGSGPMPPRTFRPTTWLEREGLLARKGPAIARGTVLLGGIERAYRALIASSRAQRLKSRLPEALVGRVRALGHQWPFVDLARTSVLPVDVFYPLAGFQVNLAGREAQGVVPRAELEPLRRTLVERLRALHDPVTGDPICRGVHLREELFDGPHAARLPDVVAELDARYEADLHFGDAIVSPNRGKAAYPHRGYHARDGLLLMNGPDVPAARVATTVQVRDVMPTILRLLDVAVPADRRGRCLLDLPTWPPRSAGTERTC